MKKTALTIICSLVAVASAVAQNISWSTIPFNALTAQTNATLYSPLFGGGSTGLSAGAGGGNVGAAGGSAPAGTGFYYELLYNTAFTEAQVSGASAPSNSFATLFGGTWLDAGIGATNAVGAGRLSPNPGNTAASVPWNQGTTNNIVIVGWSANLGTSWTTVSNELATGTYIGILGSQMGYFGVSTAGFETTSPANPGATIIGTAANGTGLPIFSLNTPLYLLPVPEPGTLALAGLGGLSLLLFRRRKV